MADIISSLKAGMTIYKVIEWFFSDVYDEIGKVYIDMAEAHFSSAEQAFKAYKKSKKPETEIRVLLSHLRDAYNIYDKVVRRTVTETQMIFWSSTSKPHCSNKNTQLVVDLAIMISFIYRDLGEISNAEDWSKLALRSFEYHQENYEPDYYELIKINSKYGYTKRRRTSRYEYTTYCYVSDEGKEFARNRLRTQKKELQRILSGE